MKRTMACAALGMLLAACAAPDTQTAEGTQQASAPKQCVLGSSICRSPGTGSVTNVSGISGDELRKTGAIQSTPTPTGRVGD